MLREPGAKRGIGWAAALVGVVLILASLGGFIFYRLVTLPERAAAAGGAEIERLVQAFGAVVHTRPRVVVNQRVVVEQASPVLELAVLEREITVERETENTWLHSTKRVRIRGSYRVKAGYDLRQPFEVDVTGQAPQVVRVQMPPAKLLSVELERLDLLTMDDGLWNHVQPEEFADQVNDLTLNAHLQANQEGLKAEAEKMLTEQLRQKIGPDLRLEIGMKPPASKPLP